MDRARCFLIIPIVHHVFVPTRASGLTLIHQPPHLLEKDYTVDNMRFLLSRRLYQISLVDYLLRSLAFSRLNGSIPVFIRGSLISRSDSPRTIPKTDSLWLSRQRRTGRRPSGSWDSSWWSLVGSKFLSYCLVVFLFYIFSSRRVKLYNV